MVRKILGEAEVSFQLSIMYLKDDQRDWGAGLVNYALPTQAKELSLIPGTYVKKKKKTECDGTCL